MGILYKESGIFLIYHFTTGALNIFEPALNILSREKPIATDSIVSDVPVIFGGENAAQFCVGMTTQVCDVYSIKIKNILLTI